VYNNNHGSIREDIENLGTLKDATWTSIPQEGKKIVCENVEPSA